MASFERIESDGRRFEDFVLYPAGITPASLSMTIIEKVQADSLSGLFGSKLPQLPTEIWAIIIGKLLDSEIPLVDPKPNSPCMDHVHQAIPRQGSDTVLDLGSVRGCLKVVYGPQIPLPPPAERYIHTLQVSRRFAALTLSAIYTKIALIFTAAGPLNCFFSTWPAATKMLKRVTVVARVPSSSLPNPGKEKPWDGPSILRQQPQWDNLTHLTIYFTDWKGAWQQEKENRANKLIEECEESIQGYEEMLETLPNMPGGCSPHLYDWIPDEIVRLRYEIPKFESWKRVTTKELCQHSLWFQEWLNESGWKAASPRVVGLELLQDQDYVRACEWILHDGNPQIEGPVKDVAEFQRFYDPYFVPRVGLEDPSGGSWIRWDVCGSEPQAEEIDADAGENESQEESAEGQADVNQKLENVTELRT